MVNVMLYYCIVLSIYLFVSCVTCLTMFVNCLVKQFAIFLGVVVILLLSVMELSSVERCALFNRPCIVFQSVCSACDPSVHLDTPSIDFVYVCRKFKSLRAGSQVFALLMMLLCVIMHNVWSGKSLQLIMMGRWCDDSAC